MRRKLFVFVLVFNEPQSIMHVANFGVNFILCLNHIYIL